MVGVLEVWIFVLWVGEGVMDVRGEGDEEGSLAGVGVRVGGCGIGLWYRYRGMARSCHNWHTVVI